ncbi:MULTISPECIES: potassium-transporting ATPase subunit F [Streptomyces]
MSDNPSENCEVPVAAENVVGLIVAIALLAYLVVALIKLERF